MKYLISLVLFVSVGALACNSQLPMSEVVKAINLEAGAGSKSCADLPSEDCLCYEGIDWHCAVIADEMDPETAIYTGKKILINDGAKCTAYKATEAAKLAAEVAKEAKKKVAKDKLKALKKSDMAAATTIVKLKDIVQILIDAEVGELQE